LRTPGKKHPQQPRQFTRKLFTLIEGELCIFFIPRAANPAVATLQARRNLIFIVPLQVAGPAMKMSRIRDEIHQKVHETVEEGEDKKPDECVPIVGLPRASFLRRRTSLREATEIHAKADCV
jgi:hypothetical protein